jgi:hypothetical protein
MIHERVGDHFESLGLDDCQLTAAGLKELSTLGTLRSLRLSTCPITDEGLRGIASFDGLEEVSRFNGVFATCGTHSRV